jgi:hypothetical protein
VGKEAAVFAFGNAHFADGAAINACAGDADKKRAVKARIA